MEICRRDDGEAGMIGGVIITTVLAECLALIYGVARWLANRIWEDIREDRP